MPSWVAQPVKAAVFAPSLAMRLCETLRWRAGFTRWCRFLDFLSFLSLTDDFSSAPRSFVVPVEADGSAGVAPAAVVVVVAAGVVAGVVVVAGVAVVVGAGVVVVVVVVLDGAGFAVLDGAGFVVVDGAGFAVLDGAAASAPLETEPVPELPE